MQEYAETVQKEGEKRVRPLTLRQERVVEAVVNPTKSYKSKGEILNEAGYSSTARPVEVFGTSAVQQAIEERAHSAGVTEKRGFKHLKVAGKARTIRTDYFPSEEACGVSDDEIKQTFVRNGFRVLFIFNNKSEGRTVKYSVPNWLANKEAADMVFQIFGTYAPKKVEGRHTVANFDLSRLRKWRKENNKPSIAG